MSEGKLEAACRPREIRSAHTGLGSSRLVPVSCCHRVYRGRPLGGCPSAPQLRARPGGPGPRISPEQVGDQARPSETRQVASQRPARPVNAARTVSASCGGRGGRGEGVGRGSPGSAPDHQLRKLWPQGPRLTGPAGPLPGMQSWSRGRGGSEATRSAAPGCARLSCTLSPSSVAGTHGAPVWPP